MSCDRLHCQVLPCACVTTCSFIRQPASSYAVLEPGAAAGFFKGCKSAATAQEAVDPCVQVPLATQLRLHPASSRHLCESVQVALSITLLLVCPCSLPLGWQAKPQLLQSTAE